jgi:hypothetical protein
MSGSWSKAELINHLAEIHSYRRYLEICTPTTGMLYARIDRSRLLCHRLMYRCPEGFSDTLDIDFRSPDLDISACLHDIDERQLRYDIILVDPWHEYETSWRDLHAAFQLLEPGGTIVVHDCLPPNETIAAPLPKEGGWCGVTYRAYIDFVTGRRDLDYCTVNTDYGCGLIRKYASPRDASAEADSNQALLDSWRRIGGDNALAFRFFEQNKEALLKLRSLEEFLHSERAAPQIASAG